MIQELDLLFDQRHLEGHWTRRLSPEAAYAYHRSFCENLQGSIKAYSVLGAQVTSVSGLKQLLLLRYSHVLVEEYNDFVYILQNYARDKEGLSDPRRATLTMPMIAEITRDAFFYEEVSGRATELTGAVDVLIESLKIHLVDAANCRDFQCLVVKLQSTCTDLKRIMSTLSTALESHLRLFELSRGMREAQNVRLLSILASIFLPLSLACGLLSMQTRFSQLHYLLYDFFGVLLLLGTISLVILTLLKFYQLKFYHWWKGLVAQLQRYPVFRSIIKPSAQIVVLCFLIFGWGLLLSSFIVGMIKDVGLGLKVLGYGVSAGVLALLLLGGIAAYYGLLLSHPSIRVLVLNQALPLRT